MMRKLVFLFIYFCNIIVVLSQTPILLNGEELKKFGKSTLILEDPSLKLKIGDVAKADNKFQACDRDVFISIKSSSAFWVKFDVKNLTDSSYLFVIDNPFINQIDIYTKNKSGISQVVQTGNSYPFSQRPVEQNIFIIPIQLKKGEVNTIYLRYHSTWRMELPLSFRTSSIMMKETALRDMWFGFFYGAVFVLLMYNFFMFLFFRDKRYLYSFLFTFTAWGFRALSNGHAFQFIFPNAPVLNNILLYLFYSLVGFTLILFTQEFLKTKENAPVLYNVGKYTNVTLLLLFFVSFINKTIWSYIANVFFFFIAPFLLIIGITIYYKGYTPARFYIIGAINYLIVFNIAVFRNLGLLPFSFVIFNYADLGFALEVLFFSLAIGDRFNFIEKERKKTQEQLNKELELKIEERSRVAEDHKILAETLGQSLALSSATLESTADGILVVNQNGKISGYNHQFVKMWNIPESIMESGDDDKAITVAMEQLVHPDKFLAKVIELYSFQEQESYDDVEFKDGRIFERYSKPQIFNGEIIGRVWSFRDVTERKKAEEEIRNLNNKLETRINELTAAQNELKKVNRELIQTNTDLDNFIYTASHDLKVPIMNIEGIMDILESKSYDEGELEGMLNMIDTSVNKFKDTVNDLTEVTKVQRMREVDIEENDMNKLVIEVLLSLHDKIKTSNAVINIDVSESPVIPFSRKNMIRIIENLLTNAIKFRDPEKQLEINIKTSANSYFYTLTIADNGLGINESYRQKVFELFKKAHDHVEGRGIGLYLIKRIIENSGGKIELKSEVGKGSSFKVFFKK